jgi:hypothetical protein
LAKNGKHMAKVDKSWQNVVLSVMVQTLVLADCFNLPLIALLTLHPYHLQLKKKFSRTEQPKLNNNLPLPCYFQFSFFKF